MTRRVFSRAFPISGRANKTRSKSVDRPFQYIAYRESRRHQCGFYVVLSIAIYSLLAEASSSQIEATFGQSQGAPDPSQLSCFDIFATRLKKRMPLFQPL
eukprot:scaffold34967_cov58-Attheya_sp.AAC.3